MHDCIYRNRKSISWNPTSFHDKGTYKIGIEGNFPNLTKDIYKKHTAKIMTNGWMLPPQDQEQDRISILAISFEYCT